MRRREVFKNLEKYLKVIKEVVEKLDPDADIYMFGSVVEGKNNFSSDVDILIITKLYPAKIHSELWKAGIKEPFEIHVQTPDKIALYGARAKLVKI